ncbi:MAG: hypothetical protein ACXVFV_00885 [Mycobacteriales bacterium]
MADVTTPRTDLPGLRSAGLSLGLVLLTPAVVVGLLRRPGVTAVVLLALAGAAFVGVGGPGRAPLRALGISTAVICLTPTFASPHQVRLLGAAYSILLCLLALPGTPRPRPRTASVALGVLLVLLGAVPLVSGSLNSGSLSLLNVALYLLVLRLLSGMGPEPLRGVYRVVVLVAAAEALGALAETLLGVHPVWGYLGGDRAAAVGQNRLAPWAASRALGTFGQPILLGVFCAVAWLLLLMRRDLLPRRLRLPVLALLGAGVLASGTRSATAAMLLVTLLWILRGSALSRAARALTLATALLLVALLTSPTSLLGFDDVTASASYTHRVGALSSVGSLLSAPLGTVVLGTWRESVSLAGDASAAVDNQLLSLLATLGLVGVVLFLVAVLGGWSRLDVGGRLLLLFCLAMSFSFEVLAWNAGVLVFLLVLAPRRVAASLDPGPPSGRRAPRPVRSARP